LRTAARAETGAPLAPERTDPLRVAPAAPFVVGVEPRVGVRFVAAGEDEAVLAAGSRRGVPEEGGLVAAAVDIVCLVPFVRWCEAVDWVTATALRYPLDGPPGSKFRTSGDCAQRQTVVAV
jgi:hypothetical protein